MFLFQEYSFLDEELKNDLERYCIHRGWIPFIDYDADLKTWVFHSITFRDLIWKNPSLRNTSPSMSTGVVLKPNLNESFQPT